MTDDAAPLPSYPTETEIDEVLAEFGGDYRKAIAALLHDLAVMAADYEASVSRGYVRRDGSPTKRRSAAGG